MLPLLLACSPTPPPAQTSTPAPAPVLPSPEEPPPTPDGEARIESPPEQVTETAPPRMLPVVVPPSASPDSPVSQTPRERFELGDAGTLEHLARGDHWLWTHQGQTHHLEAASPVDVLPDGTVLIGGTPCDPAGLASATQAPYAEVCPGLWRRNPVKGRKSRLEWGTDFLRDHVRGGEAITSFVKQKVVRKKGTSSREGVTRDEPETLQRPRPVQVLRPVGLTVEELGIPLRDAPESLTAGAFYPSLHQPGIWVAAVQPNLTPPLPGRTLDPVEGAADALLVLFELDAFHLDFAVGTEHPRLGWADRVRAEVRTSDRGPDGFDAEGPLVRTGSVRPDRGASTAAVFTGTFKRSHGAFHRGPLSTVNRGSHYGFVEDGIVWSRPSPGLATLTVDWEGRVDLDVWSEQDDVGTVRHLRQNGVPLVHGSEVGSYVFDVQNGNWSGSVSGEARSMRAGLCIRRGPARELLYGYFTNATPGAMARVFLAAGCDEAMLTDMNALEHTYLSVIERTAGGAVPHDLDRGMAVLDLMSRDQVVLPRFLALPDNRDFFTVRRR